MRPGCDFRMPGGERAGTPVSYRFYCGAEYEPMGMCVLAAGAMTVNQIRYAKNCLPQRGRQFLA